MPPEHETRSLSGQVTDVFAHRFVVKTGKGKVLADLGPKGAERVPLEGGRSRRPDRRHEAVGVEGSQHRKKRSAAGPRRSSRKPHPHPHDLEEADPKPALRTAEANGLTIVGEPRRKPKHFEILGRNPAGELFELHIELDGVLRKMRSVNEDDPKLGAGVQGRALRLGPTS